MACEEGIDAVRKWQEGKRKDVGWYVHYVASGDDQSPTGHNVHTHGLVESFLHLDFQIVCPLPPEVSHMILHSCVERIKKGERFNEGDVKEDLIENGYFVKFISAIECERPVLRLCMPDKHGKFEDSDDPLFRVQYAASNEATRSRD
jgi:hypothetical protein